MKPIKLPIIVRRGLEDDSVEGFFRIEELPLASDLDDKDEYGYYGGYNDIEASTCREFAHNHVFTDMDKSFCFRPSNNPQVYNIVRYIRLIEKKLRLKYKTKFTLIINSSTKKKPYKALLIRPSYFWRRNSFRRAIFTACIIDGCDRCNSTTIASIIKRSAYFNRGLSKLFKSFLSGRTVLKSKYTEELNRQYEDSDVLDTLESASYGRDYYDWFTVGSTISVKDQLDLLRKA